MYIYIDAAVERLLMLLLLLLLNLRSREVNASVYTPQSDSYLRPCERNFSGTNHARHPTQIPRKPFAYHSRRRRASSPSSIIRNSRSPSRSRHTSYARVTAYMRFLNALTLQRTRTRVCRLNTHVLLTATLSTAPNRRARELYMYAQFVRICQEILMGCNCGRGVLLKRWWCCVLCCAVLCGIF